MDHASLKEGNTRQPKLNPIPAFGKWSHISMNLGYIPVKAILFASFSGSFTTTIHAFTADWFQALQCALAERLVSNRYSSQQITFEAD